jgi:molecular chaperone DnaK
MTLTRAKLESLVMDLIERTAEPCRQAMKDAGVAAKQIDEVILVGGQTRMPKVQELVRDLFGKEPHKGVNPDEVVAVGAAVQAAVLAGEVKDVVLLDVTPLSLGIETLGGVMTHLIERNTTIPTKKSGVFSTAADSQTSVEVHVMQGERPMARDNRTLGKFHLVGIPPAPRGVPQIEVTFDIDANGILNVSAKDRATGKEQAITITASSGLSRDDIEKMVRDSETHAEEDKQRREEIEITNQADSLAYSIERQLAEHGEKVAAADKSAIEEAIKEVREALKANDVPRGKRASEALTKVSHKMAEALYRDAQAKGPGAGTEAGSGGNGRTKTAEGEVVDAEFEDLGPKN